MAFLTSRTSNGSPLPPGESQPMTWIQSYSWSPPNCSSDHVIIHFLLGCPEASQVHRCPSPSLLMHQGDTQTPFLGLQSVPLWEERTGNFIPRNLESQTDRQTTRLILSSPCQRVDPFRLHWRDGENKGMLTHHSLLVQTPGGSWRAGSWDWVVCGGGAGLPHHSFLWAEAKPQAQHILSALGGSRSS